MKKSIFRKILTTVVAVSMLAAAGGCGKNNSSNGSSAPVEDKSLETVMDSGKFVLGLDATFKPMGYTDENDEIVGFDIDVAEEVCKRMGVDLVKQPINWETKEEDLNAGRIDCIWNGMSVNPSRAEAMNLSDPYMKNKMIFVVPSDSEAKTMSDLADAAIGVQNGSTAQTILEGSEIGNSCTIQAMATNIEALQQMELGIVDAVFLDSVVAETRTMLSFLTDLRKKSTLSASVRMTRSSEMRYKKS